jgi:pyridoxal phosphate enzyme (YggS family)
MKISENYQRLRSEVPDYVTIVAAGKTRTEDEIRAAIDAGIMDIGENYVQEAERVHAKVGTTADGIRWHMIGHLDRNKINSALRLFHLIQSLDSLKLAHAINRKSAAVMPVLVEINSGREPQKTGVLPEEAEQTVRDIASLPNLAITGLMTMGPRFGNPENARPYFRATKRLFDHIGALDIPGVEMNVLSMGMSNAYKVAIEEGSNMVRLGNVLFGECESCKKVCEK